MSALFRGARRMTHQELVDHIRHYYPSCVRPRRRRKPRAPKPLPEPDPRQLVLFGDR